MAGVANIGSSRTWSGSHFDQANWYAYGRMAWNPQARARDVAREWVAQTFAPDAGVMEPVTDLSLNTAGRSAFLMRRGAVKNIATGRHKN